MAAFELDATYPRAQILAALSPAKLDGPWVLGAEAIALLAHPGRRDDEPRFPERSAFFWPGEAPKAIVERGRHVLLFAHREADHYRFVGSVRVASYASRPRPHDLTFSLSPVLPRSRWLELLGATSVPEGPPPEAALARLGPDGSPRDRWVALKAFLERWYARSFAAMTDEAEAGGTARLRQLHAAMSAVPEAIQHNRLVPPREWEVHDGRVVFLVENQAVCLWAAESEGVDPRVWVRNNAEGEPWVEEAHRLTGFLIQAVLFEAVMHARFGAQASMLDPETSNEIRARLDPLAMGRWNWGGAHFHARAGVLAMTMENEAGFDVWLAAATPFALSPFEDLVTERWDRVAF